MPITILDGPVGTELNARGVLTPPPLWSASALSTHPDMVKAIHREYAEAGATVHTANTFRTTQRMVGDNWETLTKTAVDIARSVIPAGQRLAGSIAPLEDCYSPDLSPEGAIREHRAMAVCLASCGVDLLLCETFPHVDEGLAAAKAALETGLETWLAFTAGPDADLMTPAEMFQGAQTAVEMGVSAILVNCTPASQTHRFLQPLSGLGCPFGVYANAGHPTENLGWESSAELAANNYLDHASVWVEMGATIIGSCCGTNPATIRALVERFG